MRIYVVLAVAVLSLTAGLYGAEPNEPRQYLIKFKIVEGKVDAKPNDPGLKVLSAPQVMAFEGKICNIKTGGELLLPDFGTKTVDHAETGIEAVMNCRRIDDESVRLDMKLNCMDVAVNQPETFVLNDLGWRILLKAKLSTPIKTVVKKQGKQATWVEVEVEEVLPTK